MIKLVQYLHGNNWVPAAVAAYSVRKHGNISAEHVLYSTDPDVLANPYLTKIFDRIAWPEWNWRALWQMDLCMERNHPYHDGHIPAWPSDFRKYALTKYGCFLHEQGEVLFLDNDILCVGDINGVISRAPLKWSARYWEYRDSPRLNGGVLYHGSGWDARDFIRPLEDHNALEESFKIHRLDDEACASWSMIRHGITDLFQLPAIYNMSIASATPKARLIHYNAIEKPWLGRYMNGVRGFYEQWTAIAEEACEAIGYPVDGSGVSDRFKWPHRLGEWKPKEKDKPLRWRTFA